VNTLEIIIRADIPDAHEDLGHEAVVTTKAAVQGICDALATLGLDTPTQSRRIVRRNAAASVSKPAPVQTKPKAVA
jgi:hypothetical protein